MQTLLKILKNLELACGLDACAGHTRHPLSAAGPDRAGHGQYGGGTAFCVAAGVRDDEAVV